MSDAVDESCVVVSLFVEHTAQVGVYLVYVLPVAYLFFQVVEHVDDLDVGTAMQRTFERSDASSNAAIGVCASRAGDTNGKR